VIPAGFILARVGEEGDPASFIELRRESEREGRGVRCDLAGVSLRGGRAEARGMPIVKAVGEARTAADATAGLLGDAFLLAAAGIRVTAIARRWLEERIGTDHAPDAVVIDPMFPPKRKRSALPRKEMVVLREVVGSDLDAAELLEVARKCARVRVALKRGDDAEELASPEWTVGGTTVRYDVWRGSPPGRTR